MAFKLKELEGDLGEIIYNLTSQKEMVLVDQEENAYQIWAEPDYLYLKDLRVNVYSAVCCNYDQETKEYEIDHDLYIFYDPDTGKEVYFEVGSSLAVCLHNYCHFAGLKIKNVDELNCYYALDNGRFLEEKVVNKKKSEIVG